VAGDPTWRERERERVLLDAFLAHVLYAPNAAPLPAAAAAAESVTSDLDIFISSNHERKSTLSLDLITLRLCNCFILVQLYLVGRG